MSPPSLNLRSKMALSFGVLCAATLILVSLLRTFGLPWTSDQGSYGEQQALVARKLGLLADVNKQRLRLWLAERESDVSALAHSDTAVSSTKELLEIVRRDAVTGRTKAQLRADLMEHQSGKALREGMRAVFDAHKVYWKIQAADALQGIVIASTDEREIGDQVALHHLLNTAKERAGEASVIAAKSPVTGKSYVAISCAVLDQAPPEVGDSTNVIGVVIMYVKEDQFVRPHYYAGGGIARSEDVYLVNQDLRILTTPKFPLPDGSQAIPLEYRMDNEPAKLAAQGKEGIIMSEDYRGVPVLAAYRYIRIASGYGWGLVVKVDQDEIFSPIWRRLIHASLISLLGVIAASLIAAVIAGRIARPIRDLSRTALEVEEGNLNARARVVGSDEVGNLALTFNSMIERVGNWHRELEEQVKNRTLRLTELNEELIKEIAERTRSEREREHLISELESKNAELERFTYTVSHDLKSPLITIKGFLGYLERDAASGNLERVSNDSARIRGAVEKMGRLLDELLELSRIGRIMNPPQDVPLAKLVREAKETLAGRISERGVILDIADELPVLHGDAARIREVVENLLDNAVKFMGNQANPRVEIGVRRAGNETVIYVKDNGTGIDPRYHDKVFGLFERLEQSTEGTGIGLAIVKRIVEVHGGRIWIESEGVGHGSVFCFTFPQSKPNTSG
ncbi:MAG: ATP-binding protein [Desulfomonilaceae bacterium]|nr:ATP-binding protein [Desulfomonilaceae bacterium]